MSGYMELNLGGPDATPIDGDKSRVNQQTAKQRYDQLTGARENFLNEARECAALTVPSLMPPEGWTDYSELEQPYQSVGAEGVNSLTAQLVLALFPPGTPFFKLDLSDFAVDELKATAEERGVGEDDARAEFDKALSKMEKAMMQEIEASGYRSSLFTGIKHTIVTGNYLVYVTPEVSVKGYTLENFVVKRDLSDNVLDIVVRECLSPTALPEKALDLYDEAKAKNPTDFNDEKNVELFTWIRRTPRGAWAAHQELCDIMVPGSLTKYPKGKCPWIPVRWTKVPGEDYGRGRVSEYLGDLRSLDALSMALVEVSSILAHIIFFVKPSGLTDRDELAEAQPGEYLEGDAKDVTVLATPEKIQDLQVVQSEIEKLTHRLERAFLLASSVQRNAERVTAEEIRTMIGQLEQSLGGVYSILSEELQYPLVIRIMHQMAKNGDLPHLPDKTIKPQIITGIQGLGRSSDLQKLDLLIADMGQKFGNEALAQYVNVGAYMKRRAAALGVDIEGLIRSDQEIQAQRQQQQMAELTGKLGGPVIGAMSKASAGQDASNPAPEDNGVAPS